jgi:hypothetical protein
LIEAALAQQFATTPRFAEDACQDVNGYTDVRSGDFVAGNFESYRREFRTPGFGGKLYWVPRQVTADGVPLVVQARDLGAKSKDPLRFVFRSQGRTIGDAVPFFPSGVVVPHPGRWRLTATAGPNAGCFELEL